MRRIGLSAGLVCLTLATTGFAQPPPPAGLDVRAAAPGAVRISWKDMSRDERWFRIETPGAEAPNRA